LGKLYITGKIVKKDISKGSKLLVEGCKNQYLPSCRLALLVNPKNRRELLNFWKSKKGEPTGEKFLKLLQN
jgi:TPR repeat protein